MGIRFCCHHCEHEIHVKDFQGGKRARCPQCRGKFRVPITDATRSLDIDTLASQTPQGEQSDSANARDEVALETVGTESPPGEENVAPSSVEQAIGEVPEAVGRKPSGNRSPSPDVNPSPSQPAQASSASDASANWHVRLPSGAQFGPADDEVFQQWLKENRVTSDSYVWRDGWPDWLLATQALPDSFLDRTSPDNASGTQTGPSSSQGTSAATLGDRNRMVRKQRRKRNHIILLSVLSVLAFVLIAALIVVLVIQRGA